jgi:F420-0:gamma-glutamyl ligase-like protein
MKNFTLKISALALAMGLGLSAGAASANTDMTSLDLNGYATSVPYAAGASVNDVFGFTVGSLASFNAGSVTAPVGSPIYASLAYDPTTLSISSFTLQNSSNQVIASANTAAPIFNLASSPLLTAGTYTLDVVGKATAATGYTLGVSVSPVPEPTEGALLLSGVGLLGFIAARRKNVA